MLSVHKRGKVLVLKLIGELLEEHLDEVAHIVEEKIEQGEAALVLLDLTRYAGAHDLRTVWREFKLVSHYADSVEKMAVVGSLDWQKLATFLVSPFTRAHERFFEPDEIDDAYKWLRT
jgi:hypothetical protein